MEKHTETLSVTHVEAWATINDVMDHLQVSRPTVYRLMEDGMPYVSIGSRRRFKLSEVDRFISERPCACIANLADGVTDLAVA